MARSVKALINPELLEWARKTTHMSVAEAAKKAKITEEKLIAWEAGKQAPTLEWTLPSPPPYHTFETLPRIT